MRLFAEGGDGELQHCDFEVELIEFLKSLEHQKDAELIINGDAEEFSLNVRKDWV